MVFFGNATKNRLFRSVFNDVSYARVPPGVSSKLGPEQTFKARSPIESTTSHHDRGKLGGLFCEDEMSLACFLGVLNFTGPSPLPINCASKVRGKVSSHLDFWI